MTPYGKMKSMKDRQKRQMEAMKKSGLMRDTEGAMSDMDMNNIQSQDKYNFVGKGAMSDKDKEMLKRLGKKSLRK